MCPMPLRFASHRLLRAIHFEVRSNSRVVLCSAECYFVVRSSTGVVPEYYEYYVVQNGTGVVLCSAGVAQSGRE